MVPDADDSPDKDAPPPPPPASPPPARPPARATSLYLTDPVPPRPRSLALLAEAVDAHDHDDGDGPVTPPFDADQSFHPGVLGTDDDEGNARPFDENDDLPPVPPPRTHTALPPIPDPYAGMEDAWAALRDALHKHVAAGMPAREFAVLATTDYGVWELLLPLVYVCLFSNITRF